MKLIIEEIINKAEHHFHSPKYARKLVAKTEIDPAAATLLVTHDDSELWLSEGADAQGPKRRSVMIVAHRVIAMADSVAMIVDVMGGEVYEAMRSAISAGVVEERYRLWAVEQGVWP